MCSTHNGLRHSATLATVALFSLSVGAQQSGSIRHPYEDRSTPTPPCATQD